MRKSNFLYQPPFLGDLFFGALMTYGVDFYRTQTGMAPLTASTLLVLWLLLTIFFNLAGLLMVALIERSLTNEKSTTTDKAIVEVIPLPEINSEILNQEKADSFWSMTEAGYE